MDVVCQLVLKILGGREGLVVEEFGLEQAKEGLDHTVVIAIAFSGHTLLDAFIFEHLPIRFHPIMPTLVRVEQQRRMVGDLMECLLQHVRHQAKVRGLGEGITNDLSVEQVQDGRQIEFPVHDLEFGDIRDPFHIRPDRFEIALQEMGSHPTHLSPIGAIFLLPQDTRELLCPHQFHDQLVVGPISPLMQGQGHAAIAVSALVLLTDPAYLHPLNGMLFRVRGVCAVVIVGASGDLRYVQKHDQRVFWP